MIGAELDRVVEAFELAQRRAANPEIESFVERVPMEDRADLVVELIRSEIEYCWENQLQAPDIASYVQRFPYALRDPERLREVAFEDCRQRMRQGQPISPELYAEELGIELSDWRCDLTDGGSVATTAGLPPSNPHLRAIDAHFSDFIPLLELGHGAAGRVYLAAQGELAQRLVALKITNEPNIEPLQLAQLQHSNIVPIYSVHRHQEWQAVCMPFMGHFTLADFVKHTSRGEERTRRGRELLSTVAEQTEETIRNQVRGYGADREPATTASTPFFPRAELRFVPDLDYVATCVWIASRIADGLAHAHRRGIVHSDLKPSNILIGNDGEPLILDFHLAQRVDAQTPRLVGGTLPYMAAEHLEAIAAGRAPGPQTDVFSLGVVLYQLLTGRCPYAERVGAWSESLPSLIADRRIAPAPPSQLNPLVSPDVDAIVAKCLAPREQNRYATASQLASDLQRHLDFLPPQHARSFAPREHFRKWLIRHPTVRSGAFISASAAVLIVALFAWFAVRTYRDNRKMAASQFLNLTRELHDASATLAAGPIGGSTLEQAVARTNAVLNEYEISNDQLPRFAQYLPQPDQTQLKRQLGEIHYLIAANELQSLHGGSDESTHLEVARRHHAWSRALFDDSDPPAVLRWQARQLATPIGDQAQDPPWRQFSRWAQAEGDVSASNAHWLDRRLQAIEHYRQGNHRLAAEMLESGLRDHASDYTAWLILGNSLARAGQFAQAETCFLVCQTLRPQSADAFFHRAIARIDDSSYREALADLDRCIELEPNVSEFVANRGLCHFSLGDLPSAEADLSRAIELGSNATRLYFFRSQVRRALGNESGADEDHALGMKLTPQDELSWISRGFYHVEQEPELAVADFQTALRHNPRSSIALENSAAVYADKLNNVPQAIVCMDQLLEIEPRNPKHWASRGSLHARNDERDAALADAKQALQLSSSGEILYRVGSVFARLAQKQSEDAPQAIRLIRAAVAKDPLFVERYLAKDPDLDPVREHPEFQEIVEHLAWIKNLPQ